ncbi:MAG: hypothetical protein ACOYMG_03795 [Candidatus Methylumidiphilus sp.]
MLVDAPHLITQIGIQQPACNSLYFNEPPQAYYSGLAARLTPGIQISERESALHTIQDFAKFESDWDGYGALPIHEAIVKIACQFINSLPDHLPCPDLTPNTNGTISMEWETRAGIAHLEVGKTRYSLYIKRLIGNAVLRDGKSATLAADVANLIGAILYPPLHHNAPVTRISYKHPLHV